MRLIGKGAMGEVWLADDDLLKRQVALKLLSLSASLSEAEREASIARFYREAQAAGKLSHRNIVVIYDISEEGGRHFISMEYLQGQTLDRVIASGPQPPERAAEIVAQVAEALDYAHRQGVVHRDIKPENIFLLPDGTVKVTDFGIARVMGTTTMTQAGAIIGTPGYMSPEQIKGERVDSRSDIFSTGVVLYELLSGVKPFDAETITSVMYKVVNEPPPPLASLVPGVPAWLAGVVERATAKDPAARYQSASQMASELRSGGAYAEEAAPGTVLLREGAPAKGTVLVTAHAGLEVRCPGCGAGLKQGPKFCPRCGIPVTPAVPAKDAAPATHILQQAAPATVAIHPRLASAAPVPAQPPVPEAAAAAWEAPVKKRGGGRKMIAALLILALAGAALAAFLVLRGGPDRKKAEEKARLSEEASEDKI